MRRKLDRVALLLASTLGAAALSGCADHISRTELLDQIGSDAPPTVIDVRSADEYATSHVPGAVHMPFYTLLGAADELPAGGESDPLVLYCEHGPRAGLARAQLWFVTDRPIRFLEGHMTAWKEEGLPVEPVSP